MGAVLHSNQAFAKIATPRKLHEDIKAAIIRTGEPLPTGSHPFNTICAKHGIEHRLIKPHHPHKFAGSKFGPLKASPKGEPQGKGEQTNGIIERFKGRIQKVLATARFDLSQSLEDTLTRDIRL